MDNISEIDSLNKKQDHSDTLDAADINDSAIQTDEDETFVIKTGEHNFTMANNYK